MSIRIFFKENRMRLTRFVPLAFLAVTATAAVAGAQQVASAQGTAPNATIQTGEIEREGGKLIYSFDMKVAGKAGIDEVNIDAMTGKVLGNQHETPKDEHAEAKADAKAAKH
jgi:hypothetical protein